MAALDDIEQQLVKELLGIYRSAERDLRRVLGSVDSQDFLRGRASGLLQQVDAVIRTLKRRHRGWASTALSRAYRASATAAAKGLGEDRGYRFDQVDNDAVTVLAQRVVMDLDRAVDGIPRDLRTILRRTQQEATSDVALLREVARGKVLGMTREEVARRIAQTLRDGATERLRGLLPPDVANRMRAIARGNYIPIVGKDGKERFYQLESYANLVAHTWSMAASNEAALRTAERFGTDLVQVTVHSNVPDEPCQRVQGKVYSISGSSPDFPALNFALPLHPHCRHRFVPVNADTLRARGLYEPLAAFSRSAETVADFRHYKDTIKPEGGVLKGVHYQRLRNESVRSQAEVHGFVQEAVRRLGAERFLEQEPLRDVVFKNVLPGINGSYALGTVEIAAQRGRGTYGTPFVPHELTRRGSWSMSSTAPTSEEAILRTVIHEISHHVHLWLEHARSDARALWTQVDDLVGEAYRQAIAQGRTITDYASWNAKEYWTESHVAYLFEREALKAHDPGGYAMVKRVRGILGLPVLD